MRKAILLSLLMCLAALALAAQETTLAGPVSGVLFDPQARALRPMVGVPGAAYLGEAIVANLDFASVSPNGRFAIAVRPDGVLLVRGLDQGNLETLNLETAGGATHAAWSADSGAVALWGDAGRVEVWTDLAGSARRAVAADLGEITAVAVASEGRTVVVAQAGAILVADGSSVRRILELEKPVALALAGGRLFVADAARNEILVLANYAEAGDAQLFANAARGVDEVVALAVSPDQRTLVAASRSARSLTAFDAATGEISATVALDFEPMRLDRFSASLFALNNGGDSGPLQILDCARSLAVYFVPAEPASVMED
jgi:hypothetical protein